MLPVAEPRVVAMKLADGTRLDADIWAPAGGGRHPVLLMRQPYGRAIASTLVFAHPAWYAAHGYVVVVQDVRGTGSSQGRFRLFADEIADGAAAAAWAADLPGGDGRLGMYGFSYQANTQYLAMAGGARPDAAAPAMAGWTMFDDWAWEGGSFRLASNLGWAAQMGWLRAMHDGDAAAAAAFQAAARALPLGGAARTRPEVMRAHAALTHYTDWLTHDRPGPYWQAMAPACLLGAALPSVPMLHVGGWYDQMLMGTLGAHAAFAGARDAAQRLVVGPWQHQPWGRRVGAVDFGPAAVSRIDTAQLAWFERHLKGRDVPTGAPVSLFDLGRHVWHDFADWPQTVETAWFLAGDGLAASGGGGALQTGAPPAGVERFVHDPWRPAPTHGGHLGAPGGMQDRAGVDDRTDVAVFTSPPLRAPLFLCGRVRAELEASADQPSFDLNVTLSMVDPQGRAWNLTQGHARRDEAGWCEVAMRATCATVPAGHCLRLSVAGACYPGHPVNPGDGSAAADFTMARERIITLSIKTGQSRLVLPVVV